MRLTREQWAEAFGLRKDPNTKVYVDENNFPYFPQFIDVKRNVIDYNIYSSGSDGVIEIHDFYQELKEEDIETVKNYLENRYDIPFEIEEY